MFSLVSTVIMCNEFKILKEMVLDGEQMLSWSVMSLFGYDTVTSSMTMPSSSSVVWSGTAIMMACAKITTTVAPVWERGREGGEGGEGGERGRRRVISYITRKKLVN